MKPRLLDLFCKAGGATRGYQQAGFYVVGVDIEPQPRYVGDEFHQADALEFPLDGFDAYHASPPCQRFARIGAVHGVRENHPDLIAPIRARLMATGKPYVIENVPDSKLPNAITLCGSSFGLGASGALDDIPRQLRRHRLFESNVWLWSRQCQHNGEPVGVYGHGGPQKAARNRGYMGGRREREQAMGIDWMRLDELSNAIPPVYTEHIGKQLMAALVAS